MRHKLISRLAVIATVLLSAMQISAGTTAAQDKKLRIAYVLHGLNDFTQTIKEGAEDAGEDLGVTVDVFGEAGFDIPTHQGFFESAIQAGYDGIAIIPNGGDPWNALIQTATDAGIPIAAANNTALNSTLDLWVGQDEYNSGVLLGQEIMNQLVAKDVTSGKIVIGSCFPGNPVLDARSAGIHSVLDGAGFELTQDYDTKLDNTENYNIWDSLAIANADAVAMVGLCSLDPPNIAQVRERGSYEWLGAGYDLETPTLEAISVLPAPRYPWPPTRQSYPVRPLIDTRCFHVSKNPRRLPRCHRSASAPHRGCRGTAESRHRPQAQSEHRDLCHHEGPTLRRR